MKINQILDLDKVEKLFDAKAKYGQLFLFTSNNAVIAMRPLTIQESETLAALHENLNIVAVEDWVFKRCFVTSNFSIDYLLNKAPFNWISFIASKIPGMSNIQTIESLNKAVLKRRGEINRTQDLIERIIAMGYKGYSRDSIKDMTQEKQLQILANAEEISGSKLDIRQNKTKNMLRQFTEGATVIGAEDITSRESADIPDFNETF